MTNNTIKTVEEALDATPALVYDATLIRGENAIPTADLYGDRIGEPVLNRELSAYMEARGWNGSNAWYTRSDQLAYMGYEGETNSVILDTPKIRARRFPTFRAALEAFEAQQ